MQKPSKTRSAASRSDGVRLLRVGENVRHALADILLHGDIRDPDVTGVSITVTEARVSPDLRNATVFVMPLAGVHARSVLAGLNRCAPYLRGQLAKKVDLRYLPKLVFRLDESFDEAEHINRLLHSPEVARDLDADPGPESDTD